MVHRFDNDGYDHHLDINASNLFADDHIKHTSKERFYLAKKKECDNSSKHEQLRHFMSEFGDKFKHVLQRIAHKVAIVKQIKHEKMMKRIRKKIIAL